MDIAKGARELFKLRKKELGYPVSNWSYLNGMWIPHDANYGNYIDKGYKAVTAIYSVVSRIIQKSSTAPYEVYKVKDKRKAEKYKAMMHNAKTTKDFANALVIKAQAFDLVENTPIHDLLDNPNPINTTAELWENLDGYLLITGNSYMYAATPGEGVNAEKPQQLWIVPSPCVTIIAGGNNEMVRGYKVSYYDPQEVPAAKIMHLKYFNPVGNYGDGAQMLYGLSPGKVANNLSGRATAADIAEGTLFRNMGPAGIISGNDNPDTLNEQQSTALNDSFANKHMGIYQAGGIMVTPAKVTWQQIGVSPVDLNIIESKREILQEVCNIYHAPFIMFDSKNSTYNNISEARKAFLSDAVIPVINRRRDGLNRWLGPKYKEGYHIDFDLTVFPEMQEDIEKQAKTAATMYWTSLNEKRELTGYDRDPDPNMDKKLVPANLRPLEDVAEPLEIDTNLLNDNNANDYNREEGNQ